MQRQINKLPDNNKNNVKMIFYVLIVFSLCLFPFLVPDPYIIHLMILSLMYAILVCSWNYICGYAGIFTFGHQGFFGIGAYFSALFAMKLSVSPWLGLLIGGMTAALLSLIIGFPCLKLKAAPYISLATLAFSEIMRIICMNLVDLTRGELGLWGIPHFPEIHLPFLKNISFAGGAREPYYYLILAIFFLAIFTFYLSIKSSIGLAFRSIRDSQDTAESIGINITLYKLIAFMVSAFFAGVVGSFYAHYILILTPTSSFSFSMMVDIIAMTLLGGIGSFWGPIIMAFVLTFGLEYMRFLGDYRMITYGLLLIIVIIFMPLGISQKIETIFKKNAHTV